MHYLSHYFFLEPALATKYTPARSKLTWPTRAPSISGAGVANANEEMPAKQARPRAKRRGLNTDCIYIPSGGGITVVRVEKPELRILRFSAFDSIKQ